MKDVTIMIPAYNEEKHIEQAILSAVHQAEYIIVSDNCSTDKTPEICKRLARKYKNIIFYEQPKNIGSALNAEFVLEKVQTKYAMHIGAHDYISENYVSVLKKTLEENPNAVLAYTSFASVDESGNILDVTSLEESKDIFVSTNPVERVIGTIEKYDPYIFVVFGLFKTGTFKKNFIRKALAGTDILYLSLSANDGMFVKANSEMFFRRILTREETPRAYMKRVQGPGKAKEYDLSYMCTHQFDLIKRLTKNDKNKKEILDRVFLSMERLFAACSRKSRNKTIKELYKSDEKYILYGAGTIAEYILTISKDKILFIVDKDPSKQNTLKDGLKIKNPNVLKNYENKIIITALGRFKQISEELTNQHNVESKRLISPVDYNYLISS